ncbi:MAG: hypothetical protein IJF22_00200 [Clostridia bacterium]|nr:hypothetical protein [Clostridia bacterium]
MKKIFSFAVILCMLIFCVPLSAACTPETPLHEKIDLTIKNYSNYDGLSIGFQNQTMQGMSLLSNESEETVNSKLKLLGKHKDGYYEEIQFEEENDGEIITTQYNIHAIQDVGPFLFVGYTNYPNVTTLSYKINNSNYGTKYLYLIDKDSGKMFDITGHHINLYTHGMHCYSENALFCTFGDFAGITKLSVKNNLLNIEEFLDTSKLLSFEFPIMTDKFNHLYSTPKSGSNQRFMISSQGQLSQISNAQLGANNIMYIGNQWINENGELTTATFVPENFTNLRHQSTIDANVTLLYQNNNTYYYRKNTENKIIKYTFVNDIEYTIEEITMQNHIRGTNGVALGQKLYFLSETSIFYIDIPTGQQTTITSQYFFNKLYLNAENELIFEALDSSLNDVKGIINPDDTIEVGITQKDFKIYFIAPIN